MRLLGRPRSILFWLQLLVAIVIVPGWAVTAVMIGLSYEHERATVQANAIGTARALVQAVDRQPDSTLAAGRALATSPYLTKPLEVNDFLKVVEMAL